MKENEIYKLKKLKIDDTWNFKYIGNSFVSTYYYYYKETLSRNFFKQRCSKNWIIRKDRCFSSKN